MSFFHIISSEKNCQIQTTIIQSDRAHLGCILEYTYAFRRVSIRALCASIAIPSAGGRAARKWNWVGDHGSLTTIQCDCDQM